MEYLKETQTVRIGGVVHCVYCGSKANEDVDWDEYTKYTSHYCNCDMAIDELAYQKELMKLQSKYRHIKPNEDIVNKLKFDHEVDQLKYKFNIKDI